MQAIINGEMYEVEPAVKVIIDKMKIENTELKKENARLEELYPKSVGVIAATDCAECKNEVDKLLCDYGIKDISTLEYILDQYQKVIVNITNNRMSYLTYPAEAILSVASDMYNEQLENEIDELKTENEALKLLIEWAEECGFGYDNFPEEYERYKDEIEGMGYIEGMIHIAKRVYQQRFT